MKLLLATNHLGLGGSESYLLTVAEQLDRLGHDALIYSPEGGNGVEAARERGLQVLDGDLDGDFDAALVQDAGVSYLVADRCPAVPQVFVAHSEIFDLQAPPQLDGMVRTVVTLNERVARRMRSFAVDTEVVRLHQPIDVEYFAPRGELPKRARRVLLLSNTPNVDRLRMLREACASAGLELTRLGGRSGQANDIRSALTSAEIVIGYGRSILEAMACGRAAYVYDWHGGDGWMTPESYPEIEAAGIAGRSGRTVIADVDQLSEDLRRYSASMGPANHDLVVNHHRANKHTQQLIELFKREARPQSRPRAPLQEMARLVRLEWRARSEVHSLVHENVHLRDLLRESHEQRANEARQAAAHALELRQVFETSVSWRLTKPLRALGRLWRRIVVSRR